MLTGFRFIEQYQNLAKGLEEETSDMASGYDQEVPQSRYISLDCDMKYQIKLEELDHQPDLFTMMDSIISNDLINSHVTDATSNKSCAYFHSNSIKNNNMKPTTASTISSSVSSFFTPSPPPTTIPPSSSCSPAATTLRSSPKLFSRTNPNHFLADIPGTGCNHVVKTDFLLDDDSTSAISGAPEEGRDYIDMDKQQLSFYDDYQSIPDLTKPEDIPDESRRLEEAVMLLRDTIYDCDDLNVPYDPTMWTPEEVRKWVSWVCHRNSVPDVTSVLYHFDGPTLCSMNQDTFSIICGDSGIKLSNELELWKTANSCFPNQMYSTSNSEVNSFIPAQGHHSSPFMKGSQAFSLTPCASPALMKGSQAFSLTPCASPALSSCSSSSNHDSSTSSTSTYSYNCDDDSIYGSEISPGCTSARFDTVDAQNKVLTKIPTGRGHKQTIHLWQFLQELLLSKDNKYSDCIRWLDRRTGVFKIEDSKRVAALWGARKNRPAMNYDKLSRSVRQYYKKGIIKKTAQSKRLVYQFCPGYL